MQHEFHTILSDQGRQEAALKIPGERRDRADPQHLPLLASPFAYRGQQLRAGVNDRICVGEGDPAGLRQHEGPSVSGEKILTKLSL